MTILQEQEEPFADVARRGRALYDEKLKAVLEPEHNGRAVAIHVDSGEYVLADSLPRARQEMHERQPEGMIFSRTIGVETNQALLQRVLARRKP